MVNKSKFKAEAGQYKTQVIFLEVNYNEEEAVYTLDGEDKTYKGVTYPSLKRLYLEMEDPTEYLFATKYLYDWDHWQRIVNNKMLFRHIEKWREELQLSLKAEGIRSMLDLASEGKSFQAGKYLAECGWEEGKRGRPSKEEVERAAKREADRISEFDADVATLSEFRK